MDTQMSIRLVINVLIVKTFEGPMGENMDGYMGGNMGNHM